MSELASNDLKSNAVKQSWRVGAATAGRKCVGVSNSATANACLLRPRCYTYLREWTAFAGARAFQPAAGRSHAASGGHPAVLLTYGAFGEGRLPAEAGWWERSAAPWPLCGLGQTDVSQRGRKPWVAAETISGEVCAPPGMRVKLSERLPYFAEVAALFAFVVATVFSQGGFDGDGCHAVPRLPVEDAQ